MHCLFEIFSPIRGGGEWGNDIRYIPSYAMLPAVRKHEKHITVSIHDFYHYRYMQNCSQRNIPMLVKPCSQLWMCSRYSWRPCAYHNFFFVIRCSYRLVSASLPDPTTTTIGGDTRKRVPPQNSNSLAEFAAHECSNSRPSDRQQEHHQINIQPPHHKYRTGQE